MLLMIFFFNFKRTIFFFWKQKWNAMYMYFSNSINWYFFYKKYFKSLLSQFSNQNVCFFKLNIFSDCHIVQQWSPSYLWTSLVIQMCTSSQFSKHLQKYKIFVLIFMNETYFRFRWARFSQKISSGIGMFWLFAHLHFVSYT